MEVVLLGADLEVLETFDNRGGAVADVHDVFDAVAARVADPLAACHELPFGVLPERVAHSAVAARETDARANRPRHVS